MGAFEGDLNDRRSFKGFFDVDAFSENAVKEVAGLLQARDGIADVEIRDLQSFLYFVPMQRHGYRGAGFGSQGIGTGHGGLGSILKKVNIHLTFPVGGQPFNASEIWDLAMNGFGNHASEFLRIFVGVFCPKWNVNMEARRTGSFTKAGNAHSVENLFGYLCSLDDLFKSVFIRIKVDDTPIRMIGSAGAATPRIHFNTPQRCYV